MVETTPRLLCATTAPAGAPTVVDYTPWLDDLTVTSLSPGGCGALRARLRLPAAAARVPRPELAVLGGRVTLRDAAGALFTGEIHESALLLDAQGEAVEIVALGGAAALAYDPLDAAYGNQTAGAILADQFARRAAYLALDPDQALVLPTAPAATFSPVFDGATLEDVLRELVDLLGDYVWGVWPHASHRDSLGLPTWQLAVHPRDTTTVGGRASLADCLAYRVAPSAVRAFNGVTLRYMDALSGPASVTALDPRLAGDLAQGTAPFRFRRFRRDLGALPFSAAQALALANTYLASFQNVANVIALDLAAARDAAGRAQPLWRVRADTNILVPELLFRLPQLTTGIQPGGNLLYIRQATYRQRQGAAPVLTLRLDQTTDFAAADLTRLRYAAQQRQRSRRAGPALQPLGLAVRGMWSTRWGAAALAGDAWGGAIQFPVALSQPPTGVSFTPLATNNVGAGPTAGNLTAWGCDVAVTAAVGGAGYWIGTYQTTGN